MMWSLRSVPAIHPCLHLCLCVCVYVWVLWCVLCYVCQIVCVCVCISGPLLLLCPACFPRVQCTSQWRWITLSAFLQNRCRVSYVYNLPYMCKSESMLVCVHMCSLRASHICLFESLQVCHRNQLVCVYVCPYKAFIFVHKSVYGCLNMCFCL